MAIKPLQQKSAGLIILIGIDIILLLCFLRVRSLPRLLIWNIKDIRNESFFYPEDKNFYYAAFEKETPESNAFRQDLAGVIDKQEKDMDVLTAVLGFIYNDHVKKYRPHAGRLQWGPPSFLLDQLKNNVRGINCFHNSILFSSYASALGFKVRVWALEGDDYLEKFGHSVVEVYVPDLNKWVMFDPSYGVYFLNRNAPLAVLELRDCLLEEKCAPSITALDQNLSAGYFLVLYKSLLTTVFLRSASDFSYKLNNPRLRWGILSAFAPLLATSPYYAQRAIELSAGRKDYFFHYVDQRSKGLYGYSLFTKTFIFCMLIFNGYFIGTYVLLKH